MMKKILPMFDRVLVLRMEPQKTTKGGIVLPESAQEKVTQGQVIAVGPGLRDSNGEIIAPTIKVGDTVLLPNYGGTKVKIEPEKDYQLFRERDILAMIK